MCLILEVIAWADWILAFLLLRNRSILKQEVGLD